MTTRFDIERARRETRGCEDRIHFNNAGASLPPIPVADALYDYLREEEEQGGYEVMARRAAELDNFYTAAARLLTCSADEIAFADSATRAWNAAFYAFDFQPGDRILASSAEYGSSLVALLHQAKRLGVEISWVPDDPSGQIDINSLESQLDKRVKLICLTQVPSGGGLVNPAAKVGKVAKAAGIPYLVDACQALGQMPVDVDQLCCDLLCGTGRKFLRGPRGTGLLYVRKTLLEQLEPNQLNHHAAPLLSANNYQLRSDAKRFECWERSYAAQLALGVAIDYALAWGLGSISERVSFLATTLRQKLAAIDGVTLADQGLEPCAIVTFSCAQMPVDQLQQQLALRQINTSSVPFSANPVSSEKLHHPALLRASLHYYNTVEEIECFVTELKLLL
ncbi:MAG: aminotransferase class V-fold PLP-dependent enzyme [Deltaproteobacteria bacterium]|nr:MAG: aminotransferase class V-fold PLP-dependent enzyme [Deltaproteobacteria bacterium]